LRSPVISVKQISYYICIIYKQSSSKTTIQMPLAYQRIISLVPSLTELLVDLGLQEFIVGRTRFCVHPKEKVEDIPIIGGTKNPRLDRIKNLSHDYVLANKEENRKDDILELAQAHNVRLTDISTIEDALITIHELGKELGAAKRADQMVSQLTEMLENRPGEPLLRTAYFIWRDPWMTIGRDTYIHDVMKHWNLINIFEDQLRYPKVTLHDL